MTYKNKSIIVLLIGLVVIASCKNNDDSPDTPGNPDDKEVLTAADSLIVQQQMAVVNILGKLTGRNDIGPDFDQQRFEPDYGSVRDEAQPYVRAIAVSDEAEAERQFLALVGNRFVEKTADGLKIKLTDMNLRTDGRRQSLGTLTFHTVSNGERLAYTDVAIDCLPTLRRIEYIDEQNWGDNANSPYMLGQIVYYGGSTYTTGLYICVRTSNDGAKTGRLIHFEAGAGASDCSYNLDGDDVGCWVPYHPGTASDMEFYMQLMMKYNRGYRNAISNYLQRSSTDEKYRKRIDQVLPWGFRHDGYLYYGVNELTVILNAEYDSESEWLFGRRRKVTTWKVSAESVSDYGEEWPFTYWYDDEWEKGFRYTYHIQTMNIIKFGSSEINGAVKVYDPAPDAW